MSPRLARQVTWCWTNWTFGVYSVKLSRSQRAYGIDFGPLEIIWRRKLSRSRP
jgi:hypothetical protein